MRDEITDLFLNFDRTACHTRYLPFVGPPKERDSEEFRYPKQQIQYF